MRKLRLVTCVLTINVIYNSRSACVAVATEKSIYVYVILFCFASRETYIWQASMTPPQCSPTEFPQWCFQHSASCDGVSTDTLPMAIDHLINGMVAILITMSLGHVDGQQVMMINSKYTRYACMIPVTSNLNVSTGLRHREFADGRAAGC